MPLSSSAKVCVLNVICCYLGRFIEKSRTFRNVLVAAASDGCLCCFPAWKTCFCAPWEALDARFPFVVALWNMPPAQTLLLKVYSEELEVLVSTLNFTKYVAKSFVF